MGAEKGPTTLRHVAAACTGRAWQNVAHDAPSGGDLARCGPEQWAYPGSSERRRLATLPTMSSCCRRATAARSALRITLAVAGFSVDELAVTVEGGQLIVRGKQADERCARLSSTGVSRRGASSGASASPTGSRCGRPSCTTGCSPSSSSGPMKDATVRTVRIADGEVAGQRREALPPKRPQFHDAE